MNDRNNGLWLLLVAAAFVVGFLFGAFTQALGQTPPVSTIQALPDTIKGTLMVELVVEVTGDVPPDDDWVGIYWTTPAVQDWQYAGATQDSLTWQVPADGLLYQFASTVADEGYDFTPEAWSVVCFTCPETDPLCPPLTTLEHVSALASAGFDMQADSPAIMWHWTHPTTGSQVVEYIAEWWVDGSVSTIPGIAVGDTTYAYWEAPYTVGQTQKLRVKGKDAQDREGPWSLWSDPWTDQGPPGATSVPLGTLIMVD